jgi:hypothetical protein
MRIGEIVDIEAWLAFARASGSGRPSDSDFGSRSAAGGVGWG